MAELPSDLETLYRNQVQANLVRNLDSAVQAGDIQAARRATQELSAYALHAAKNITPAFSNTDIREALKTKAPWFGVDPRRSARAIEYGKNMEPARFKSAEEFADKIIEEITEEFDPQPEDDEEEPKKIVRKKTDAPSGDAARAIPRRASLGTWTRLSDAPRDIADQIKRSTEKFTRNATKEQRDKFISTALERAYAVEQQARGKK